MLELTAIRTTGFVDEGATYFVGAIEQKSQRLYLMDRNKKKVIGTYNSQDTFGISSKDVLKLIVKGTNP